MLYILLWWLPIKEVENIGNQIKRGKKLQYYLYTIKHCIETNNHFRQFSLAQNIMDVDTFHIKTRTKINQTNIWM